MNVATYNTTEAAEKLGVDKVELLENMMKEGMVERTRNRHYKANPVLIRAGMATPGDLQWTDQGLKFLRKAYKPVLS